MSSKKPSIQSLIQSQQKYQKFLLTPSPLSKPPIRPLNSQSPSRSQSHSNSNLSPHPYFLNPTKNLSKKLVMIKKNSWEEISEIINYGNDIAKQLKDMQLEVQDERQRQERELWKMRNYGGRLKVQLQRLKLDKKKRIVQMNKQQKILQDSLSQLDKLKSQTSSSSSLTSNTNPLLAISSPQIPQPSLSPFPSLQSLIPTLFSSNFQTFLNQLQPSHPGCQAIDFFNLLAMEVKKSDSQIRFLQRKILEEEDLQANIEKQGREREERRRKEKEQGEQQEGKENLRKLEAQVIDIQKEIKEIRNQGYLDRQLKKRVDIQKKSYQYECQKLKAMIMKLWKVIEISGEEAVIEQGRQILKMEGLA